MKTLVVYFSAESGRTASVAKSLASAADDMDIIIEGSDEKQAEKAILDFFSS